jgi:hypothetical protein
MSYLLEWGIALIRQYFLFEVLFWSSLIDGQLVAMAGARFVFVVECGFY